MEILGACLEIECHQVLIAPSGRRKKVELHGISPALCPFPPTAQSFRGSLISWPRRGLCGEAGGKQAPPSRGGGSGSKRSRAAEVHNLSEKGRSRINEKMRALQNRIPNSNKTDKASMLDEAIEYLKQLQLQVQGLDDSTKRSDAAEIISVSQSSTEMNDFEKLQYLTKSENILKQFECDEHEFASKDNGFKKKKYGKHK